MKHFMKGRGWAHSVQFMKHKIRTTYLVPELDRETSVDRFNYHLIDRLLHIDPPQVESDEVAIKMEVDTGDAQPGPNQIAKAAIEANDATKPAAVKEAKKKKKQDDTVFLFLGAIAVVMVAFYGG